MKILLIGFLFSLSASAHDFDSVHYLRAYDGDTITVNIPSVHPLLGAKISIRVNGIDTPEIKGKTPCEKEKAIKARDLVRSKLESASVSLKNASRGKYFRIVADVYYNGVSLAETLIRSGLAVPYDGGTKSKPDWCAEIPK